MLRVSDGSIKIFIARYDGFNGVSLSFKEPSSREFRAVYGRKNAEQRGGKEKEKGNGDLGTCITVASTMNKVGVRVECRTIACSSAFLIGSCVKSRSIGTPAMSWLSKLLSTDGFEFATRSGVSMNLIRDGHGMVLVRARTNLSICNS